MTIFELVRVVLDELYEDAEKAYKSETEKKISHAIKYLSESYWSLDKADREPIDYKDPAIRFAYVFKYVPAHGDYIVQILRDLRNANGSALFPEEYLRVSCVGGGPGSDLIGVLKYLDERGDKEGVKRLKCYLLDREQAWADTWTEIDDSLETRVLLKTAFQPLDVTNPDSWASQKKFLQADIFTMSYFVSEVFSLDNDGCVTEFWNKIFSLSKPGAAFLYLDNGSNKFNQYFDDLAAAAGLELIAKEDNVQIGLRGVEQSGAISKYKEKFAHYPKIKSKISWRVLRKPDA